MVKPLGQLPQLVTFGIVDKFREITLAPTGNVGRLPVLPNLVQIESIHTAVQVGQPVPDLYLCVEENKGSPLTIST